MLFSLAKKKVYCAAGAYSLEGKNTFILIANKIFLI